MENIRKPAKPGAGSASMAPGTERSFEMAIIENMGAGLCVCHTIPDFPRVRFTVWNRRMHEITGYTMEEINRLGWYQCMYPDLEVQQRAIDRMSRMRRGDDLLQEEWVITRADGTRRTLEISSCILEGEPPDVHVLAVMHDMTKAQQAQEDLRTLSAHLESVRETERATIAREVHDELGQALTVLRFDLAWLAKRLPKDLPEVTQKVKSMGQTINATIRSVQRIAAELRPSVLDNLGLPAAIEWQTGEFSRRTGIPCRLAVSEAASPSSAVATAAYRIFQEAMANILRHSRATEVQVALSVVDGRLLLEVADNGKGIVGEALTSPHSFGLLGMRERAISCGGEIEIAGGPGRGTTVRFTVPLEEVSDDNRSAR